MLDNFKLDTFKIPFAKENHFNVVKQRYNAYKPSTKVALTAVRSKAKIMLLLLVHRLLLFPLFVGGLCFGLVLLCSALCPFLLCSHLASC